MPYSVRRWVSVVVASATAMLGGQTSAQAQLLETLTLGAISDFTINQLFNRTDETISKAVGQAQNAGNGLLMSFANKTSILEQDAIIAVGDQREKLVKDLDVPTQNLLLEMEKWRLKAQNFTGMAYTLEETANLDLAYNLQKLPFTHMPAFFVQGISGTAFLKRAGGHKVTLRALNLGIQENYHADISVELDHKPIQVDAPDQSSHINQATITLPSAILDVYFQQDKARTVPLLIKVDLHTVSKRLFGLMRTTRVVTYEVPVNLTLYPELAANVTLTVTYPHYDWLPVADIPGDLSAPTPDKNGCHCEKDPNCAFKGPLDLSVPSAHKAVPVEGDQRIIEYHLECIGGDGCAFAYLLGSHKYDNDSHVTASYQTCSRPVQVRLLSKVQKYARRAQDDTLTLPAAGYFGKNTALVVPGEATAMSMHVMSYTGQTSDFDFGGSQLDPQGLISRVSLGDPSSPTRTVVFTAALPP